MRIKSWNYHEIFIEIKIYFTTNSRTEIVAPKKVAKTHEIRKLFFRILKKKSTILILEMPSSMGNPPKTPLVAKYLSGRIQIVAEFKKWHNLNSGRIQIVV